jgi:twitching motility protein PilI
MSARPAKLDLRAFQQELASRLAAKTAAQVESSRLGLSCGGEYWLIRLADAAEVIALPPVASVPLTKPWFCGVANLRGNLYSVIDFARFIGRESAVAQSAAAAAQQRLVVFGPRTGELRAGILVERVLGLRNIGELAPAPPDASAPTWFADRWLDAAGVAWQEIDLARLAQDPAFLQVGV